MKKTSICLATTLLVLSFSVQAQDWPQWRGKDRIDHSPDKGLLKSWPSGGPKKAWMFENAGIGYSGPAIVAGKLYTMGAREDEEQLICLDAATGKELWAAPLAPVLTNNWGDGPRATPTVDAGVIYAMSARGVLVAVDASTKKSLWKVDMTKDLGGKLPGWGYTESVLVDGNQVICTPGGKKGAMAALDKKTGRVIWQSKDLGEEAWYSSPVVAEIQGKRQYVQLCHGNLFGADAKTGDILWKTPWRGGVAVIPTPIIDGNSVYITSGYNAGCKKVTIGKNGEVTTDYDMEKSGMVNHHGGVILVDGHLYGHSDAGGWTCQKLSDGSIVWQEKKLGKGAVGFADGMLYCLDESNGEVVLAEASPKGWNEKGRFKLDPQTKIRKKDGRVWTHPVIIGGKLYLRDQDLVYCFNVKG